MTRRQPVKLVVCDDNDVVRDAVVRALSSQRDVEVVGEAASSEELLELMATRSPDVILLDANLPGISGPEGIRALRAHGYDTPVVMMSADHRQKEPAKAAGAATFYYKGSADFGALVEAVRGTASR